MWENSSLGIIFVACGLIPHINKFKEISLLIMEKTESKACGENMKYKNSI